VPPRGDRRTHREEWRAERVTAVETMEMQEMGETSWTLIRRIQRRGNHTATVRTWNQTETDMGNSRRVIQIERREREADISAMVDGLREEATRQANHEREAAALEEKVLQRRRMLLEVGSVCDICEVDLEASGAVTHSDDADTVCTLSCAGLHQHAFHATCLETVWWSP
jgi:hypothetical protein